MFVQGSVSSVKALDPQKGKPPLYYVSVEDFLLLFGPESEDDLPENGDLISATVVSPRQMAGFAGRADGMPPRMEAQSSLYYLDDVFHALLYVIIVKLLMEL